MSTEKLQSQAVSETINQLSLRIHDRFPQSGLYQVCRYLFGLSKDIGLTVREIGKTNWFIKVASALLILTLAGLLSSIIWSVIAEFKVQQTYTLSELVTTSEAAANLLVFLAIVIYFLWTLELKIKRKRVITAINRLRDLTHIIDMHQLTKAPSGNAKVTQPTKHSPKRTMTDYELGRYLDYCTEMLSLISKLGYLYVSSFRDTAAMNMANELETLTTGLSRKIWQKIMILHSNPIPVDESAGSTSEPPQPDEPTVKPA